MKSRTTNLAKPFIMAFGMAFLLVTLVVVYFAFLKGGLSNQSKAALVTKYTCMPRGECSGTGTVVSNVYCGSTCRTPRQCCKTTATINTPTPSPTPTPTKTPVKPGYGQACKSSKGWAGTCRNLMECASIANPHVVADWTTCKDYVCCAGEPGYTIPDLGQACTTSKGWPGTCTTTSNCLLQRPDSSWAWDQSICMRGGCCGKKP